MVMATDPPQPASTSSASTRLWPWAPFALLLGAALWRPLALVCVPIFALALIRRREASPAERGAVAVALPIAVVLAWGGLRVGLAGPGAPGCLEPMTLAAGWRALEALVVVALIVILGRRLGTSHGSLGLRRPGRGELALAVGALAAVAAVLVLVGPFLATPFFGPYVIEVGSLVVFIGALVFGLSNAFAEELAYRAAPAVWLGPIVGDLWTNVAQALLFGIAHSGADFNGPQLPVIAAMTVLGLLAYVLYRRTGSLALLVALHAAADVPLYLYWACRVG